ncbi:uncharacterized protein LOC131944780 [Physella acuta]|uniref:uncharacterized protein LOC131944780 n=1 Tax=Physella acuta TaxID=109671 RepID=UPI0027DAD905|nr:uncharacterized protein LOC131944780 [Physella acuta]
MVPLLLVMITSCIALAQKTPCHTSKTVCEGSETLTLVNSQLFCCDAGYSIQWKTDVINGTSKTDCICERQFYVTDCIEDEVQCRGATSLAMDGRKARCCKNGDSMTSASRVMIHGITTTCKCVRQIENKNFGAFNLANTATKEPTMMEQLQYLGSLGLLPEDMQAQVNLMNPNQRSSSGIGSWAMSFLEGVARGVQQALTPSNQTTETGTSRRSRHRGLGSPGTGSNGLPAPQPSPSMSSPSQMMPSPNPSPVMPSSGPSQMMPNSNPSQMMPNSNPSQMMPNSNASPMMAPMFGMQGNRFQRRMRRPQQQRNTGSPGFFGQMFNSFFGQNSQPTGSPQSNSVSSANNPQANPYNSISGRRP